MSDQVDTRQTDASTSAAQARAAKRAAAKAAAIRAAEARRRRNAILGALAGFVAVVVIIAGAMLFGGSRKTSTAAPRATGGPAATAPAPTDAAASAPAAQEPFPPLPAGADPALGKKPAVTGGTGDLSKLTTTTLIEGKGPAVQAGQTITVNYVGVSYKTGDEFDSSWSRSEAFPFPLGAGQVIPGWDQGLVGVKVGSRVQLDIPTNLAYGDNPGGGAPAGPLRFVVDVLAAK